MQTVAAEAIYELGVNPGGLGMEVPQWSSGAEPR